MTATEALKYFGGANLLARMIGLPPSEVIGWLESDQIPDAYQLKIQQVTGGDLVADCQPVKPINRPISIRLDDHHLTVARTAGDGNVSRGIRAALDALAGGEA